MVSQNVAWNAFQTEKLTFVFENTKMMKFRIMGVFSLSEKVCEMNLFAEYFDS